MGAGSQSRALSALCRGVVTPTLGLALPKDLAQQHRVVGAPREQEGTCRWHGHQGDNPRGLLRFQPITPWPNSTRMEPPRAQRAGMNPEAAGQLAGSSQPTRDAGMLWLPAAVNSSPWLFSDSQLPPSLPGHARCQEPHHPRASAEQNERLPGLALPGTGQLAKLQKSATHPKQMHTSI